MYFYSFPSHNLFIPPEDPQFEMFSFPREVNTLEICRRNSGLLMEIHTGTEEKNLKPELHPHVLRLKSNGI